MQHLPERDSSFTVPSVTSVVKLGSPIGWERHYGTFKLWLANCPANGHNIISDKTL
jgi:hypothetical protein